MYLPHMLFTVLIAHCTIFPISRLSHQKNSIMNLINIKMFPCVKWLYIYLILILIIACYFSNYITNVRMCNSLHLIHGKIEYLR